MISRSTLNWNKIYQQKINSDMTVEQFISRIKNDPWEIYKFDIRYVIEKLREESIRGTQVSSKNAREILKKAGLQAFIPKEASKRKTHNPKLKSWENNPFLLIQEIEHINGIMRPYWKRLSKNILRDDRNRNCIQALLNQGEELTEDMLYKITEGERDKDLTHLAISVLAVLHKINFEKLKKTYYSSRNYIDPITQQKKSTLELLRPSSKKRGVHTEELKKVHPTPFGLKTQDYYKFLNKRDDSVPDKTYPELIYENTFELYSMHHRFLDLAKQN